MKKKTYRVGGQNPPQEKPKAKVYGPPKPPGYRTLTEDEERERAGEKAYLELREQVDREVRQMRKDGATEEQINRHANKVLSTFGRR
jgi:hypothetical protein